MKTDDDRQRCGVCGHTAGVHLRAGGCTVSGCECKDKGLAEWGTVYWGSGPQSMAKKHPGAGI